MARAYIIGGGCKNGMPLEDCIWASMEKKERTWLPLVMGLYRDTRLAHRMEACSEQAILTIQ
jgi:hypothetical protein